MPDGRQPIPRKAVKPRRKPRPPDVLTPWPILILAVDPGANAGWAVYTHGQYSDSGEVKAIELDKIREIAWVVITLGRELGLKTVLVLEHHPWGGHGRRTAAGIEARKQTWRDAWRAAGGSPGRVVQMHVQTWRSKLLGRPGRLLGRVEARALEQATAERIAGRPCGPDEAPAVCMGEVATKSGLVGAKLPKSMREPPDPETGGSFSNPDGKKSPPG